MSPTQGLSGYELQLAMLARVPVLLWGPPGTGKSSFVRSVAQVMDLPIEVVIASVREPSDFIGLPVVASDGVRFSPPAWARRLQTADRGVLFFDDITTAPPATQAALLRVVLERVVGDEVVLGENVAVVAAANPPETAPGGWELSAPLANRFIHLQWEPTAQHFVEGMLAAWPRPELLRIDWRWPELIPEQRARIASFLRSRPELACKPPQAESEAGGAWPSFRTWTMAATLLAVGVAAGAPEEAVYRLVVASVGNGPATEFWHWQNELDLPAPEDMLRAPRPLPPPARADLVHAVLNSVTAAVVANNTPRRWEAAWEVIAQVAADCPDVAILAARVLATHRPPAAKAPPLATALERVLQRAGVHLWDGDGR